MSEFEDNRGELSGLSELSEPISEERGETYTDREGGRVPGQSERYGDQRYRIPPDVRNTGRALRDNRAYNDAPMSPKVISSFDTRPVNSKDFIHTDVVEMDQVIFKARTAFRIPRGYVGILREFRFYALNPILWPKTYYYAGAVAEMVRVTVKVNGVPDEYYSNLKYPEVPGHEISTHILCPGDKEITLELKASDAYRAQISDVSGVMYHIQMRGNLLLSRNLPPNFEVISQL